MIEEQIKTEIKISMKAFSSGTLSANALNLFNVLGYITERQAPLDNPTFAGFYDAYINDKKFDPKKAKVDEWKYVDLLFQLSKEEVLKQTSLFDTKKVDNTIIETYLFFCIELEKNQYSRTELSLITREVNRIFPMPVMILFKHGNTITLSVINRRLHKRDETKDVLEKVTLIKDISIEDPHRAHVEILYDLSFEKLQHETEFTNFVELHNSWHKTLNIKLLNDRFYKDIASWFYWACKNVEFPDDDPYYRERDIRNSENVIRLLTRIIFCWFMKEKGLIKLDLFSEKSMEKLLVKDADKTGSTYYKAILQNLFFATLNIPVKKRKFISDKTFQGKNTHYFDHSVFRYKRFFKPNAPYLSFFKDIPFLNGGLFECQDYMIQNETGKNDVFRIDCFSENPNNEERLKVPDDIFFGKTSKENWLNDIFGTKNLDYTVQGIFRILSDYKFTIEENTPLEEEIALDPDLLGIVFENLLASYNPETRETARKQTGSFYTPREIVTYMVEESLIAYFKNKVDTIPESVLRELISSIEANQNLSSQDKNKLIQAIDTIKILDPACGSGAFPMGILQKLVHVLHKLDPDNHLWRKSILERTPLEIRKETEQILKTKSADYIRKLGLIQNCIYGVDIQPIAVEISKLRFFLALLVDFEKTDNPDENWGIEPLPNLDFKIMQGDTLVEEFNGVSLSLKPDENTGTITFIDTELQQKIEDLHESQGLYLRETHPAKKKELKEKVNNTLIDILHYHLKKIKTTYFSELSNIEDTVKRLGNKEQAQKYFETEKVKIDKKFGFNYLKFEKDLKDMISGKKPRNFFPYSLFFADVFEEGGFDIVLGNPPYITYKGKQKIDVKPEYIELIIRLYPNSAEYKINSFALFTEKGVALLKKDGNISYILPSTILQNEYLKKIRKHLITKYQVQQIVTFGNKVFEAVTDSIILFAMNSKRKMNTTAIRKNDLDFSYFDEVKTYDTQIWNNDVNDYVINLKTSLEEDIILNKIDLNSAWIEDFCEVYVGIVANGIKKFLSTFKVNSNYKKYLQGKHIDKYALYPKELYINFIKEELHSNTDEDVYLQKEKILVRKTGNKLIAVLDTEKFYTDQSIYNLYPKKGKSVNMNVVCGLLNSKLLDYYFNKKMITNPDVFPYIKGIHLKKLPLKFPKATYTANFANVVGYIHLLKKHKATASFFERLIDAMVYELYFLKEIENAKCEVLKHITNLPALNKGEDVRNLKTIEKIYKELSDPNHPVSVAMFKMDTIEEIRIIEGKQ
jgi:adenine-specific DNA-methyltransferase